MELESSKKDNSLKCSRTEEALFIIIFFQQLSWTKNKTIEFSIHCFAPEDKKGI